MKKSKKLQANFQTLDDAQMKNIKGGTWIEVKNPDGTTTTVWI